MCWVLWEPSSRSRGRRCPSASGERLCFYAAARRIATGAVVAVEEPSRALLCEADRHWEQLFQVNDPRHTAILLAPKDEPGARVCQRGMKGQDGAPCSRFPQTDGTQPDAAKLALVHAGSSRFNERWLVQLKDGAQVECVLYRGDTLCVSSQVGCAVRCPFCASGARGLSRGLELDG